jgi:thymidylate synthase (FAD)
VIKATYVDHMGSDLSVVNAARVSFGKKSEWEEGTEDNHHREEWGTGRYDGEIFYYKLSEADTKLIHYLAKHKHYSPFGHCFASFHIKAPIFVARQLVKHEYLRMNEISRRYVDSEPEFYVPEVWRGRAKDKKQGSSDEEIYTEATLVRTDYNEYEGYTYRELNDVAVEVYQDLLSDGVAPEMARMVLPQSMYTEWYWSGSMDAFANMCNLRLKEDTQYETRLVAQQIDKVMGELYPVSWKALVYND